MHLGAFHSPGGLRGMADTIAALQLPQFQPLKAELCEHPFVNIYMNITVVWGLFTYILCIMMQ